jgi:hypothetical protein
MWIVDDFLPPSLFNDIQNLTMGDGINWTYRPGATSVDTPDEFYFSHTAFLKDPFSISPLFNDIKPILYFMDDRLKFYLDDLIRINCTMCTNRGKIITQAMHVDYDMPHYTGIFYCNTTNGPTVFEDSKVDSVANRFVLFDGSMKHAATLQDDCHARVNIVFNMQGRFRK